MLKFDDSLKNDFQGMLNLKEFAKTCLNNRTLKSFNVIITDGYVLLDAEGLPTMSDKPLITTSRYILDDGVYIELDIKQDDILTIEGKNYRIFEIRKDGFDGYDIYLKDWNA